MLCDRLPLTSASAKHRMVATHVMIITARHCSLLIFLFNMHVENMAANVIREFMIAVKMYDRIWAKACIAAKFEAKYNIAGSSSPLEKV